MGSSFIITESMLEKCGKKLMSDFVNNIDNVYLIENFREIRLQKDFYNENVVRLYRDFMDRKTNLIRHVDNITVDRMKDFIKNAEIETKFIHEFLSEMDKKLKIDTKLEFELDEDFYCLKKAFLNAYDLFHYSGHNLVD